MVDRHTPDLVSLVDRRALVRVSQGTHAWVGRIDATGTDAVRGKWCILSTEAGDQIEITERVPMPFRIDEIDADSATDSAADGGVILGMEP